MSHIFLRPLSPEKGTLRYNNQGHAKPLFFAKKKHTVWGHHKLIFFFPLKNLLFWPEKLCIIYNLHYIMWSQTHFTCMPINLLHYFLSILKNCVVEKKGDLFWPFLTTPDIRKSQLPFNDFHSLKTEVYPINYSAREKGPTFSRGQKKCTIGCWRDWIIIEKVKKGGEYCCSRLPCTKWLVLGLFGTF